MHIQYAMVKLITLGLVTIDISMGTDFTPLISCFTGFYEFSAPGGSVYKR